MAEIEKSQLGGFSITDAEFAALLRAHGTAVSHLLPHLDEARETATKFDPSSPSNIVGVGIGMKVIDGARRVPTVVAMVREKVGRSALAESAVVPREIDGILSDVIETGEYTAYSFLERYRPCPGGASIGVCNATLPGTVACVVRDGSQTYVLGNNHVLARLNNLTPGSPVPQPSRRDGGVCPADTIGTLAKYIPLYANFENQVDCAVVAVSPRLVDTRVLRNGSLESLNQPVVEPVLEGPVQKSGRTTGHSFGAVRLVNVSLDMNFGSENNPIVLRLANQFAVLGAAFSRPGDSGSLVTTYPGNQPVGLLVGGASGYTVCNCISVVLQALEVEIAYEPLIV